jgi:hypothetical protein
VCGDSSDTLVRLASGLDGHCVKKQCGLVRFRRTHGSRPSHLPSPYGSCSDKSNYYQLDTKIHIYKNRPINSLFVPGL